MTTSNSNGFIRGPCEGLRPRAGKDATSRSGMDNIYEEVEEKPVTKKVKKPSDVPCSSQERRSKEVSQVRHRKLPHEVCNKGGANVAQA